MKNLLPILLLAIFTTCQNEDGKKSISAVDKTAMAGSVKLAFQQAWAGYKQYAWGHDALTPLSRNYRDWYAESLLMTPVDAFDTMKMLGMDAFMPALLALGGDLDRAKQLQESCFKIWNLAGIEPEMLDYSTMKIIDPSYALRPENIESAFYLYQFTKDDRYLEMGKTMFDSMVKNCKTDAGVTAILDVTTMEQADDMESFFFAETLKYAWLLFSVDTWDFKSTVFNTEAHPICKTWWV